MMTCPTCSTEAPEGAAFCPACGIRLVEPEPTIAALIDRFITDYGYKGTEPVAYRLEAWKREIGELTASELDRATVEAHRDRLLSQDCRGGGKLTPSAVRVYLYDLRAVFVEYGIPHIFDSIEISMNGLAKFRLLTTEEMAKLSREAALSYNPHLFALVTLALECGLRKQEAVPLEWEAVNFPECTLTVTTTRAGHSRTIPLTDTAATVLHNHAMIYRCIGPWCFPALAGDGDGTGHIRDFSWAWQTTRRRAGLMDITFADLRNIFGVRMAEQGLCCVEVARLMGYRDSKTAERFRQVVNGT